MVPRKKVNPHFHTGVNNGLSTPTRVKVHVAWLSCADFSTGASAGALLCPTTSTTPPRPSLPLFVCSFRMAISADDLVAFKNEGNEAYKQKNYADAIAGYSKAVKLLPDLEDPEDADTEGVPRSSVEPEVLKQGAIIMCNRAAAYMGDSKPIPALADAQRASDFDPSNWKAHWRCGLSIMMMKPRLERSEQAIAAFERTLKCASLPDGERENVRKALQHAEYRLKEGKDSLDMPDMSNCVVS